MKMKMALATASLAALSVLPVLAQDADHTWAKNYPVTGKPTLNLETGDAGVQISSCGSCREVRIHIETVGIKLSETVWKRARLAIRSIFYSRKSHRSASSTSTGTSRQQR